MLITMLGSRKISHFLVLAVFFAILWLHLAPILLVGLFSYMILDLSHRSFARRLPAAGARWLALVAFLIAASAISSLFIRFVRQTVSTLPTIAASAVPKLVAISDAYGIPLPFDNFDEMRSAVILEITENAKVITKASGTLLLGLFHGLIAVFIAILCFFCAPDERYEPHLFDAIRKEANARLRLFLLSFEKVFGAQIAIASINTLLTALFLAVMGFPHSLFLVLSTFILGMLPIIGNILSNTLIIGTALTLDARHAAYALVFLIVIHKGEYFLNSRIVGAQINAPMWQTLLAILLGEVLMGVPGIILAPVILHYVKEELRAISTKPA